MLHIENTIVIKETENTKYGFLPLTVEEFTELDADNTSHYAGEFTSKEFKEKYGLALDDLVLHGDVTEVDNELICNYINMTTVKESEIQPFRTSYECFCGKVHGLDYHNAILHGSAIDSWNCLLIHTWLPKYGMIINLKSYEKSI